VLEDLQWAGPGSLRLLEHLSYELAALPMLVVATVRDEPALGRAGLERTLALLRQHPRCRELPLGGLSRRDVAALLEAEIGRPPPPDLSSELFARTEGIPLFLREAIRLLGERGDLRHPERVRRWAVALPSHVLDLVRRPLERVSPDCAELLAAASVLGREFAVGLAVGVAGLERSRALDLLDEAEGAGVVEASPEAAASWRFTHALFHEAVYARLPAGRTRLHAQRPRCSSAAAGPDPGAAIAELAPPPPGPRRRPSAPSPPPCARGGAPPAASRHEQSAMPGRRPRPPSSTVPAWSRVCASRRCRPRRTTASRRPRALRLRARALKSRARSLGDPHGVARAAIGLCDLSEWSAPDPGDREALDVALEVLGDGGHAQRARLLARAAYVDAMDAPERSVSAARRAVELARACGDAEALDEALYVLHVALWGPDHRDERALLVREVTERAVASTRRDPTVLLLLDAAAACLAESDREGALRLRADAAAVAGANPHPGPVWNLHTFDAGLALLEGRFDEGVRFVRDAAGLGRRIAHPYALAVERGHRALLARDRRHGQMLACSTRQDHGGGAVANAFVGRALAAAGRREEAAERLARLAARSFEDVPRNLRWTGTLVEVAGLCADLADEATAPRLLELLTPVAGRHGVLALSVLYGGPVARALARLLALLGRLAEASDRFEEAEGVRPSARAHDALVRSSTGAPAGATRGGRARGPGRGAPRGGAQDSALAAAAEHAGPRRALGAAPPPGRTLQTAPVAPGRGALEADERGGGKSWDEAVRAMAGPAVRDRRRGRQAAAQGLEERAAVATRSSRPRGRASFSSSTRTSAGASGT
jgi:hypothetical protein